MEHFYRNIQGWFDFQNIYSAIVASAQNGSHFVEVGSWKGSSAAYMAVEIANSEKNIKFDCVDVWTASEPAYDNDQYIKSNTLFEHFVDNMRPVEGYYNAVRKKSTDAAQDYADASLDFVFIDAEHTYTAVIADITAWLPKVKSGGMLAGHDYATSEGVRKAVHELLPSFVADGTSWKYIKP